MASSGEGEVILCTSDCILDKVTKGILSNSIMKKFLLASLLVIIALTAAAPLLLFSVQDNYHTDVTVKLPERIDSSEQRLASALTFKTISQVPEMIDSSAFEELLAQLNHDYPYLWANAEVDTFGQYTLLIKLNGSSSKAQNYLLISHVDVVPVDQRSLKQWDQGPFDGTIENDYIYGRGALDDKSSALGTLEALESMLKTGWIPENNLYFSLGQDEEIGGNGGANLVAQHCRDNNLFFEAILDEGGIISKGSVPGLEDKPIALIGVAEKGYLSIEVNFNLAGGHSSMPERENAIAKAAEFVTYIQSDKIFQAQFSDPVEDFITHLAPEMSLGMKTIFALRPLTNSIILSSYQKSNTGRALTNNTAIATMISAGIKDNVVPTNARVVCNTRILPGTTQRDVIKAYELAAAKFGGIVSQYQASSSEATATSSSTSQAFIAIGKSITQTFPDALVSPYLTIGGTDSKNFTGLSKNTYRFLPIELKADELSSIHGTNERISIDGYHNLITFYQRIILAFGDLPS